ncbi:hypothetical protein D4764_04G0010470 [Takifugu flavidus]|uniref:Uncharacterized protein n=1 Tax=Takifugu flavidus TaxID=433684 RepID=A0A5C6N981_9TELE|nr:hypothetical protein D4764_04G0010470 [Takifugu flavidus]
MREPPEGVLSSTPSKDSKKGGYAELMFGTNNSQDPSPHPKAKGGYPLIHRGKLQYTGTELGSKQNCHPCLSPLTISNSRVVVGLQYLSPIQSFFLGDFIFFFLPHLVLVQSFSIVFSDGQSPTPLEKTGSRALAVRREPVYAAGDQTAKVPAFGRYPTRFPCPDVGHRGSLLEPGLGVGHAGEHLVAGPLPMESGRAQPEKATWDPLPVGSPPAGGAKGRRAFHTCKVFPIILTPKLESNETILEVFARKIWRDIW